MEWNNFKSCAERCLLNIAMSIIIYLFLYLFMIGNGEYEAIVVAGSGKGGSWDGTPTECCFDQLEGIAVDEKMHSCFVSEQHTSRIRKITFVDN
jgi:hypothetical protein